MPLPSEATLWSFPDAPLRQPSGFSLKQGRAVRTDQISDWDFLAWMAEGEGGEAQFRPRAVVLEDGSDAGLQRVDAGFEELEEAPEDGYVTDAPVRADSGAVYAARSRQDPDVRTLRCFRFAKLEVLSVDRKAGTVTVRHVVNPNCEDRDLTPGPPDT